MNLTITSKNTSETESVAGIIGSNLQGGEAIELVSDLGGGKTAFVRGLARGAGSQDRVTSPTFTISNIYDAGNLRLMHFDFYRLKDAGLIKYALREALDDPRAVVVVEWGELIKDALPKTRLRVLIETTGEEQRQLRFVCPDKLRYLTERL